MSSHWVACQLFPNEVHFYDSAYSTVSADTLDVLAQLIRTDQNTFTVKVMNTSNKLDQWTVHSMQWPHWHT